MRVKPRWQVINELKEINYRFNYDIIQQGKNYPEKKAFDKFFIDCLRMHLHEKFKELTNNRILP